MSGALFRRIAHLDTLTAAWKHVRLKGASGGSDGTSVQEFARAADAQLAALRRDLLEGRYAPQPLREIAIPKGPRGGERRILRLPSVRDKVVQEAVRMVMEPRLERQFLDCSYGYRPGKGPQKAVGRVSHYIVHMKRRWAANADIDDFFGSLDQDRLVAQLRTELEDEAVLHLIQLFLKMGAVDWRGRWRDIHTGVGQGGVISPLLANFYLHPFDQEMTAGGAGLVRYADDFVLLCAERAEAEEALGRAAAFLRDPLGLHLNENAHPVASVEDGFSFLGIRFQGNHRSLDPGKREKIAGRIGQITGGARANDVPGTLGELNEAVTGWRRYYGAVLPPQELDQLDTLLRDGLVRLVGNAFRRGAFRRLADAETALASAELVGKHSAEERRAWIGEVVRAGRASGIPEQKTAPSRDPEKVVRRRKRRYLQAQAQVSELVVNTPGCFLGKSGERVVVREGRRTVAMIPAARLTSITLATHGVALSSDVIALCAGRGIPLLLVAERDQPAALLTAPESPAADVGLQQLRALSDPARALELARAFARGKIRNQLNLMKYLHKYGKRVDSAFSTALDGYVADVGNLLCELEGVTCQDDPVHARGRVFSVEGRAAAGYWELVGKVLRGYAAFDGREGHGARDLVNSLLNYSYALLRSRVHLAVLRAGLVPEIGFLHSAYRDRPALVFDLMEEFRPHVVDRTVITLLRRRERLEVDKAGLLTGASRKRLIATVHTRLASLVRYGRQQIRMDEVIHQQARRLARHLRGEDRYRPWIGRW